MFNFAYDDEYEREFFYFRLSGHLFCVNDDAWRFRHQAYNWFPYDSKEVDFDSVFCAKFWHAASV